MADLAPDDPASIGGYRLLSRLGTGGMGRVYLARSEGGRTVAVKLIKAELAQEELFRTRFRLEVEAARRVGDRWTAPVLDADTEAATPWVATGYIAGPSLEQVIAAGRTGTGGQGGQGGQGGHGPLPGHSLRVLAYGLASALLDIHGAGLVHRDLKPSNVLLTIDGPRVIDFGIARALDDVPESTLTSTGMVVGSPSFMSPEQIKGGQITTASDVFCLGTVLAYAATGRPPFGQGGGPGGVHSLMFRIAEDEPDLEGCPQDAGPLRELIADCLAKEPGARPAPEEVVARVQPVPTGASTPPWLPAELIAELGRHAVQLLDTDTPPSGSGGLGHSGGSGEGHVRAPSPSPAPSPTPAPGPATGPDPEPVTSQVPRMPHQAHGEYGGPGAGAMPDPTPPQTPVPGPDPSYAHTPAPPRRRTRRTALIAGGAVAAVLLGGIGYAATGAELPLLGGKSGGKEVHDTDVPRQYLGTWSGPVERDGEPTGQHRRFVITKGEVGEVVATSVSLGAGYACESDGKLSAKPTASAGLHLDTKVVKSVPEDKCSALGEHTLTSEGGDTLRWRANGRTATLHKISGPEKLPARMAGEWQRSLPNGGTQRLTVTEDALEESQGLHLVSDGGEHCEATMDVFSAGREGEDVRVAPPAVKREKSRGACAAGGSSTLALEGEALVRKFPNGSALTYTRGG